MLKEIGAQNGKNIVAHSYTRGGATLHDHYNNPEAVAMAEKYKPDYLIIQEQSQDVDIASIRKWIELGKINGAKVILYHTWVDNCKPMLEAAGNEDLTIAPVGYAFNKFNRGECLCPSNLDSIPVLNNKGDFHPSAEGSYLAAIIIYKAMYGKLPLNPPESKTAREYWSRFLAADCRYQPH